MRTGSSIALNSESSTGPTRRILIIDDDRFWQAMIHGYLRFEKSPMVVDVAATAEDALALFEYGEHYDLIIADYLLEGRRNGRELFQAMKVKENSTFLLTSAHDVKIDKVEIASGMRYVGKNHLHKTLKEILAEKSGTPTAQKSSWNVMIQSQFQFLIFATIMAASALYMASLVARNGLPK